MIYVWFVLYGFGYGAGLTLSTIPRARYFGRKAFGSIHGSSTMLQAPGSIIAPIYAGWVYDITGSYITAFMLFGAVLVFAVVLAPFARPPKLPAKITEINKIM
ncbi:YbfB/YjiJ family MFS transporter [Chloroflexota bacterium]